MDRIGSSLVHGFAGGDVRVDVVVAESFHCDECGFRSYVFNTSFRLLVLSSLLRPDQTDSSDYLMRAAGKQTQHSSGIGAVAGLAEDFCIYNDDGVGAKNKAIRLARYGKSFFSCHSFGKRARSFSGSGNFWNIGRLHHE